MQQNSSFQISSQKFVKEADSVDTFIWQFFLYTNKFIVLRKVLKMLVIFSNGQAIDERGLSVNGKLLVENLQMESLIAQIHIHGHMQSYDLQAHYLDITRDYWTLSVLQENVIL